VNELLRRALFLPPQASAASVGIDHLHFFVILTTIVVSSVAGVLAVYFMARYRRRRRDQPTPHLEAPRWLEATFVLVPLSFFLLWFRIGFGQFVDMTSPPADAMDVYVTGKQWMWKFAYPEGPSGLEVLRVPEGRPVRLLLTSRDVIHGFFVPAFRLKQDALPGRYTQTWFVATRPGTYPVYCSQYCGTSHSMMRASIEVMEAGAFDRWREHEKRGRARQRDTALGAKDDLPRDSDMAALGRSLAESEGCLKCHSVDGSPHIGPTWLDLYRRTTTLADGTTVLADEAYLTESMMDPRAKQVAGFPLTMPSYAGKLGAPETAALLEYIKSLRASVVPAPVGGPLYERSGGL
jgi:cytochrome c oxidase subunit II